jgi:hypothetical protein
VERFLYLMIRDEDRRSQALPRQPLDAWIFLLIYNMGYD